MNSLALYSILAFVGIPSSLQWSPKVRSGGVGTGIENTSNTTSNSLYATHSPTTPSDPSSPIAKPQPLVHRKSRFIRTPRNRQFLGKKNPRIIPTGWVSQADCDLIPVLLHIHHRCKQGIPRSIDGRSYTGFLQGIDRR